MKYICSESTGENSNQNNAVAQIHLCPEYCPQRNTQKDLPSPNWPLPCFFTFSSKIGVGYSHNVLQHRFPHCFISGLTESCTKSPIEIPIQKKHVSELHITHKVKLYLTRSLNGQKEQVEPTSPEDFCREAPEKTAFHIPLSKGKWNHL